MKVINYGILKLFLLRMLGILKIIISTQNLFQNENLTAGGAISACQGWCPLKEFLIKLY